MLDRDREDALLAQAVAAGLLSVSDVSNSAPQKAEAAPQDGARADTSLSGSSTLRFGPRLDFLIAQGKLSAEQVERWTAEQAAFDRTLDGSAVSLTQRTARVSVTRPAWLDDWSQYEVIEPIGQGGMGTVYRGRDLRLSREVALKFITVADEQLRKRFLTEARAQARLNHEHICKVFEVGEVGGHPYIAMELVRGKSLSQLHAQLNREQKLALMRDISFALHAAHSQGVIHRDVKPSNVMVETREDGRLRPVVMDFGLARDQRSEEHLTMTGMVMGTPAYMSPEQAAGEVGRIDRRSDVYSLGAMLYELLAGQLPFAGTTTVAMILQVIQTDPAPLRKVNAELPLDLETIVSKAMAKEPQRRYDTAKALAEDLDRFLNGEPILARKASLLYVAYRRAQKNKALVTISALGVLSVMVLLSLFVRSRMLAARERALAERAAQLSQQLGQDITQMELFMRAAYLLPAHDITRERLVIRNRVKQLADQLQTLDVGLRGPAHYALGRGYLVLEEYEPARAQLEAALRLKYDRPEVHYALGYALGQLYQVRIQKNKQEYDPQVRTAKRKQIDAELLAPTRDHLARSRDARLDSNLLAEGWLYYYEGSLDKARESAQSAAAKAPWDYQPLQLLLSIEIYQYVSMYLQGQRAPSEQAAVRALAMIQQLKTTARSLPFVYAMQSLFYREAMFQDLFEHRSIEPNLQAMLRASREQEVVTPDDPDLLTERAVGYSYLARQKQERGQDPHKEVREAEAILAESEKRGATAATVDLLRNNLQLVLAAYADRTGEDPRPYLSKGAAILEASIRQSPPLFVMWNDLCATQCELGRQQTLFGQDNRAALQRGTEACQHTISLAPHLHIGYQNQTCLLIEEAKVKLGSGQPVDVSLAQKSLSLSLSRKPSDVDSLAQQLELHLLSARSLSLQKQRPDPALTLAKQSLASLQAMYPSWASLPLYSAMILRTQIELSAASVSDSELAQGLSALSLAIEKQPGEPSLRFVKACILLARSLAGRTPNRRADLLTVQAMLTELRPLLGQQVEYQRIWSSVLSALGSGSGASLPEPANAARSALVPSR